MREKVQLASKFGVSWKDGALTVCGDPAYVRSACEASLKRLEIDCIDLYYAHRIDTRFPIEVTVSLSFCIASILAYIYRFTYPFVRKCIDRVTFLSHLYIFS